MMTQRVLCFLGFHVWEHLGWVGYCIGGRGTLRCAYCGQVRCFMKGVGDDDSS